MNKKLKIAICSGSIPSTTFIENLIEGVSGFHKVYLFGNINKKTNYKIINSNIKVFGNSSLQLISVFQTVVRSLLLLLLFPKRIRILGSQITKQKSFYQKRLTWIKITPVLLHLPDILHIQWAKDLKHWIFLKEKLGVKIVLSLRGAHINYSPLADIKLANLYRENFPKVDAFHAVSKAIGFEAQKYGADASKIKTIHSLISKSTFDLFKKPKERTSTVLKIISVGRHHWKKGYATALDTCKLLKDKKINFTYTIVAGGSVPEELIIQRNALNLIDEVQFVPQVPQDQVFKKMQQASVLLLPSLEEGIANVVLEAMALGLPVISTDCGGMNEVVVHRETGWLVPILDAEKKANALIDFNELSDDELREVSQNAYELVGLKFSALNEIQKFERLYESLI